MSNQSQMKFNKIAKNIFKIKNPDVLIAEGKKSELSKSLNRIMT